MLRIRRVSPSRIMALVGLVAIIAGGRLMGRNAPDTAEPWVYYDRPFHVGVVFEASQTPDAIFLLIPEIALQQDKRLLRGCAVICQPPRPRTHAPSPAVQFAKVEAPIFLTVSPAGSSGAPRIRRAFAAPPILSQRHAKPRQSRGNQAIAAPRVSIARPATPRDGPRVASLAPLPPKAVEPSPRLVRFGPKLAAAATPDPVPLPGSLLLLSSALACLIAARRR